MTRREQNFNNNGDFCSDGVVAAKSLRAPKAARDWCPTTLTMEILITGVIDTDPSSDYIISVNGHCSFAFLADINIRQITHEENDVAI